ncbi:up-regulator of cell proliferation-like [Xiphias gladius]|uniref:up-regulator of cell proliferation-like n=1 Tax=Xiphias gladius TaxID=8245 RepID=UPI001A9A2411|nr:up-regulator of cell proliferation-like [Xiphias gladius]
MRDKDYCPQSSEEQTNEEKSQTSSTADKEGQEPAAPLNFLSKIGLEKFYPNKLTLRSLLEINKSSIYEEAVESVEIIPWCFLRKLFEVNAECRSCAQLSISHEENDDLLDLDLYAADDSAGDNKVNPLDIVVALFLCADSFLQQEMALKMSMCQFSLPLLLPHGNKSQCTLLLWALRDIVKEWCPHGLSESRGFVEDNIVQANIPFYSFVRLKNCSLSKSQLLNHVLSSGQQNRNIFIHRDVEGGAVKREIANGLVEVCWFLPCGTENLDIFPEPVAFANLRGDICASLTQFNFLFQVSTATFVFLDKVEENEHRILASLQDVKSKLCVVVNKGNTREDMMSVKTLLDELDLPNSNVKTKDSRLNVAEFSKKICAAIRTLLTVETTTMNIETMVDKAVEQGLSVDEWIENDQKEAVEEFVKKIGEQTIQDYKLLQLPLQGENWKRLSHLEMEEFRLKKAGGLGLEEKTSQLREEQQKIRNEQSERKPSTAMTGYIEHLSKYDKEKRDVFLKWMKLKLNAHSRTKVSELRNKFKEQCKKKDVKLIAELDQALLDSSLGIEHYMREMGLIYEFSIISSTKAANDMSHLPGLAAELLLDGYPLELLDGDASNIPERWVTDVLMELHKKVGGNSRLLVLTVLGVQSTGKSTLLNTMFGVQFPVSSGRCTRGAFMLFLKVSEDMQSDFNFDFIVLIDTEGLKSPDLAQLEDSYEHDNQLATLVIGLSDVTIINIAMENSTEMKDVLQIAIYTLLRMKKTDKKPVCHFVHQNVAGVSAHTKIMTEKKHLLDQLNEMTQIAAQMERQPSIKAFTDVLDYDMDKNNWNIPGLWHGTPPMAPVNTGYSEAVADFKKNLLDTVRSDRRNEVSQIPEFLEWMRSLWRAVKYENFIFSFRNTLVAHAFNNLCKEFTQWEWEFRREILSWQTEAVLEILHMHSESDIHTWERLVASKKLEASEKIEEQERKMKEKLDDYYRRKDRQINLIETYIKDVFQSINNLADEIKYFLNNELDFPLEFRKQVQEIQTKCQSDIELWVTNLLRDCNHCTLSDEQLTKTFEKMWTGVIDQDTHDSGSLQIIGKVSFEVKSEHQFDSKNDKKTDLQRLAESIIESCTQFVLDKAKTNTDYNDGFTIELLEKIDSSLQGSLEQWQSEFEIDLKLHICGIASREFLKMQENTSVNMDPKRHLEKKKTQYLSDFLDLYKKRDHCQRKASDFVQLCIKPAVKQYICRSLGVDIVDEILTSCHSAEYSSRLFFQYNIQKELLQEENFKSFVKYIRNYEIYVKDWIFQRILQKISEDKTLCKIKNRNLQVIIHKIMEAIKEATKEKDGALLPDNKESITELISNMRRHLIKDISISVEAEKSTLFQIQSTCHPFINSLKISIKGLKEQLEEEFSNSEDITETLNKLPIKPQDELFKRVFGCGKQCPFCKVPCEAGGKEHKQHHAAIHRPQGLANFIHDDNCKLVETLCTTDVHSDHAFRNKVTKREWHPYKDYTTYYPDWNIPPDPTIEASDYWKYILVQYNDRFAREYEAKPADVPEAWGRITKEQALKGLKDAFNIK